MSDMTPQERHAALDEAYDRGREWIVNTAESWLADKDAEIERLRAGRDIEQQMLRNVPARLADERRRTAEEIKRRVEEGPVTFTEDAWQALGWAARICDEVGGSA